MGVKNSTESSSPKGATQQQEKPRVSDKLLQKIKTTLKKIQSQYAPSRPKDDWITFSPGGIPMFKEERAHPLSFRGVRPHSIPDSPSPLFRDSFPLPITIRGKLGGENIPPTGRERVFGDKEKKKKWRPATLQMMSFYGERIFDINLRFRGNYRYTNCGIPPMKIEFKEGNKPAAMKHAKRKMKIVNSCQGIGGSDFSKEALDQKVLLEHLAYEALEVIGVLTLRSRLLKVRLEDEGGDVVHTGLGLALENKKDVAERSGSKYIREGESERGSSPPMHQRMLLFFAYTLIGNQDYNNDHNYYHNTFRIQRKDGTLRVIPYDFDLSDLVKSVYDQEMGPSTHQDDYFRLFSDFLSGQNRPHASKLGIEGDKTKPLFFEAAKDILGRRGEVLRLAEHPLLTKESAGKMRDRFNAYFDGLQRVVDELEPKPKTPPNLKIRTIPPVLF